MLAAVDVVDDDDELLNDALCGVVTTIFFFIYKIFMYDLLLSGKDREVGDGYSARFKGFYENLKVSVMLFVWCTRSLQFVVCSARIII